MRNYIIIILQIFYINFAVNIIRSVKYCFEIQWKIWAGRNGSVQQGCIRNWYRILHDTRSWHQEQSFFRTWDRNQLFILRRKIFIPAFLQLQGDILIYDGSDLKPFASLKVGGLFCTSRSSNIFNFNPSIGIRYSKFALSVGYIHQYGVDKDNMSSPMGGPKHIIKSKYNYDGVTIGLIFSLR